MKYLGLLSSAASGKLGGIVASHNRGGAYFRGHVVPVQPRTPAQTANRNQLAAFSAAFKSLTSSQVAGWNALGSTVTLKDALGNSYNPTGQQLFVSCNRHLASLGITTTLTNAPSIPSVPGFTTFTVAPTYTSSLLTAFALSWSPSLPADFGVLLRATSVQTQGRTFIGKSLFRTLGGYNPSTGLPSSVSTIWENVFGPFPGQGFVGFELKMIDPVSGFAGPPIRATCSFESTATTDLFTLATSAQSGTTTAGSGTVTFTITPTAIGSFSGAVTYSVTGLPAATTFSYNHNPYAVASAPVLSIVAASATAGTYHPYATGSYGAYETSVELTLTIA